eukprot:scaffold78136_cov53-Attheya_sp.AAC.5
MKFIAFSAITVFIGCNDVVQSFQTTPTFSPRGSIRNNMKQQGASFISKNTRIDPCLYSSQPFDNNDQDAVPSWMDLPKPLNDKEIESILTKSSSTDENPLLPSAEMFLGRIAMVSALILFTVEATTGQSLPQQVASAMGITT